MLKTPPLLVLLGLRLHCDLASAEPEWQPKCEPHVVVPNGVEVIPEFSLQGCKEIRTLTLSNTTRFIQQQALQDAGNLTEVRFSPGQNGESVLELIGDAAFDSCSSLGALKLPKSVTHIGFNAFASTGANGMNTKIPTSVKSLNDFFGTCPAGSEAQSYRVPDQYTSISNYAFSKCTDKLLSVEAGANVMTLGFAAFAGAKFLKNVYLPMTMWDIGASAFEGCRSLEHITLPSGGNFSRIRDNTFHGCDSLGAVDLPDSIAYIAETAFTGCSSTLHCQLACPKGKVILTKGGKPGHQNSIVGPKGCTTAIFSEITCGDSVPPTDNGNGTGVVRMLISLGTGIAISAVCLGFMVLKGRSSETPVTLDRERSLLSHDNNRPVARHQRGTLPGLAVGFGDVRVSMSVSLHMCVLLAVVVSIGNASPVESRAIPNHARYDLADCVNITKPSQDFRANTKRIQTALDGRGCVSILGEGDYPVLSLKVGSDTRLHIGGKTRLVNVVNETRLAVVHVYEATNVIIDGGGTIYGDAEHAWGYWSDVDNRMSPYFDDGLPLRANTLLVENSKNIMVRDIHLHNSTDWTFKMVNSSDIYADNLDIYGDSRFPNNDGFDPMSCRNVTLVNSRINVADDGVCPKAQAGMGPVLDLFVQNVTIRSKSHAIKFGSNTDTLMANIIFDNVTIWDSNGGMSIQQRSEGDIRNVTFSNIQVETRYQAPRWWGNGEWVTITNNPRGNNHTVGKVSNVVFVNISGRSENGGLISGLGSTVENLVFSNIHIKFDAWSNYSTGRGPPCYADADVCSNETGSGAPSPSGLVKCARHEVKTNTKLAHCMGSRDYRPTPGSDHITGNHGYYTRLPGKVDGIFLENAHHVKFHNVTFKFAAPRKSWFGECIRIDKYSTGVIGSRKILCDNGADESML